MSGVICYTYVSEDMGHYYFYEIIYDTNNKIKQIIKYNDLFITSYTEQKTVIYENNEFIKENNENNIRDILNDIQYNMKTLLYT